MWSNNTQNTYGMINHEGYGWIKLMLFYFFINYQNVLLIYKIAWLKNHTFESLITWV